MKFLFLEEMENNLLSTSSRVNVDLDSIVKEIKWEDEELDLISFQMGNRVESASEVSSESEEDRERSKITDDVYYRLFEEEPVSQQLPTSSQQDAFDVDKLFDNTDEIKHKPPDLEGLYSQDTTSISPFSLSNLCYSLLI